ncbi:CxC2 domain-containing protein [Mycena sanguinolenta]|uniref:CxC2 domain-containing protein n=1 Tax=Mycena sanguinolenta TaxID=230812 RepID=A0A8H7D478_9AGAR|nr:CxC2 domain-containing protein [Mycena sanguinolenta]
MDKSSKPLSLLDKVLVGSSSGTRTPAFGEGAPTRGTAPTSRKRVIFEGPPSSIRLSPPRPHLATSAPTTTESSRPLRDFDADYAAGRIKTSTDIRAARETTNASPRNQLRSRVDENSCITCPTNAKGNKPQLVAAATVTSVSHTTHDQRRVRTKTTVVGDAGPSSTQGTDLWAEDLATNLARNSASFSYQLGDNSLEPQLDDGVDDGITVVVEKSARNTNSDRPLKNWYPKNDEYVEESLRREGRGLPKTYSRCAGSRGVGGECLGDAEWRCVDQLCFGELMYCSSCIVSKHVHHPTHFVERWTGTHFLRKRNWLQLLGLRVQLGHPPASCATIFVLYDLTGVHELNVDFCGCRTGLNNEDPPIERRIQLLRACWWPATITAPNTCASFAVLRLFHKLNCLGKVSAYDFLRGLEMTTNHGGLDKPPAAGDASCSAQTISVGDQGRNGPRPAFDAFTKGLKKVRPDQVEEWRGMVDTWEATQHTTPEGSPFELKDEASNRHRGICMPGDGIEVERDHSPGTFITMGLEIEEAQRKLTVDTPHCAPTGIHKFREIQRVYMPSVRGALSVSQKQMFDGNGEQLPEATRLFMPSELPDAPDSD